MFELNESIKKWKEDLCNKQSLNTSDVTELQLHLEDTIENLGKKGLSQEEAFWVARHRVGDSEALQIEFSKVNQADIWKKRILWLLSGHFLITAASSILNLCLIPLHLLNIPWTMFKTSFFGLEAAFPIPLYVFTFIMIGGVIFLLTSRKNIRGKTVVNRLCSSLEKKNYRFIIILFGLYLVTTVGSAFLTPILIRYDPATFASITPAPLVSITLSSRIFFILRSILLITLAGIFTFQLSVKKKYEAV